MLSLRLPCPKGAAFKEARRQQQGEGGRNVLFHGQKCLAWVGNVICIQSETWAIIGFVWWLVEGRDTTSRELIWSPKHTYQFAYGIIRTGQSLDLSFKHSLFFQCEWCESMFGKTTIHFSTDLFADGSQSFGQVEGAGGRRVRLFKDGISFMYYSSSLKKTLAVDLLMFET